MATTWSARAVTIDSSALMPALTVGGTSARVAVTVNETTELSLSEVASGVTELTVASRSSSVADTSTLAGWPAWMLGRSASAKSAVTWTPREMTRSASPVGAYAPAATLIAAT